MNAAAANRMLIIIVQLMCIKGSIPLELCKASKLVACYASVQLATNHTLD